MILAKYHTFRKYIFDFKKDCHFKPYLAKERDFTGKRKTFFYNEAWNVVNESYDLIFDLILTFLNICFNIGVISIAIEKDFIIAYMSSFIFAFGLCFVSQKKVENLSLDLQDTHVNMNTILRYGWDTIMADNEHNACLWKNALKAAIKETTGKGVHKLRYVTYMSCLAMLFSMIPVFFVLIKSFLSCSDADSAAVLVVTLPRQVNTIQYLNILISAIMNWNSIYAKILGLNSALQVPENLTFDPKYINFFEVILEEDKVRYRFGSFDEIITWEKLKQPGRITIRGGNGVGKSTILIGLKTYFKDKAYYYSPNMEVYFEDIQKGSMSSGETVLSHMQTILKEVQTDMLLLDEWDADLDAANIKKISGSLDQVARTQCILEVRHRNDE